MRRAEIHYGDLVAGILTETDEGDYTFQYDLFYAKQFPRQFITFTMPVSEISYISNRLFRFLKD